MPQTFVDRLEPRVCFAAGVVVTSELLVGPDRAITALTIGFSGPLDPAAARDVRNYALAGSRGPNRPLHPVAFAAAGYEPGGTSVTLTTDGSFRLTRFRFLRIQVLADRAGGLTGADGARVDGDRDGEAGGNAVTKFRVDRGTTLRYTDADRDRVTLRVRGGAGGKPMTALIGPNGNVHEVWVSGANNTLVGTVKPSRRGDGQTPIGRVVLDVASNTSNLASPFNVGQTVIDGQTGADPAVRTI